jgi:hypothetical protein
MSSGGNKAAASASNASRTNNSSVSKNASSAADSPLPPMLSPTLPAWVDEVAPPIPQRMLSPTLPAVFDTPPSEKTSGSFMVSLKLPEKSKGKPVGLGIQQKGASATNGAATSSAKRKPSKNAAAETKRQRISRSYSSSSESESEQPLAARKTPSVNSTTNSTNNKNGNGTTPRIHDVASVDPEQRERHCKLYRSKMRSWMGVAKQKKHEADQASADGKPKTAAAISLDSVLCFVVAFDYEDKADFVMKSILRPHSWYTLVPYMSQLIKLLERANCKELMGLCYQFRALIYARIAQSYSQAIKKMAQTGQTFSFDQNNDTTTNSTTNDDKKETLGTLPNKYISMQEASQHDFKRGFQLLTLDTIKRQFPITWKSKQRSPSPLPKQDGGSFRPKDDSFYLPLHTFSTLQEATALGYKILREWADLNNISTDWAIAARPSN